jgi:hypothetical protein
MNKLAEEWCQKYWRALDRATEWEQRCLLAEANVRRLMDAVRWHEQQTGTDARKWDHELYRTAGGGE